MAGEATPLRMTLMVDIKNAFDLVEWSFFKAFMLKLNFLVKFVEWV